MNNTTLTLTQLTFTGTWLGFVVSFIICNAT